MDMGNEVKEQENPIIKNLKIDINNIEESLKTVKPTNFKRHVIKDLKISAKLIRFLMPFALVTYGTFTIASKNNFTPVKLDDVKICQNIKTEFDNRNNETVQYQYEEFSEIDNKLFYTGKWNEVKENYYEREYRVYPISLDKVDLIKGLLKTDEDLLLQYLGEPLTTVTTVRNNVPIEEQEEDTYINVITYGKDGNKCTMGKESKLNNAANTLFYLAGNAGLCLLVVATIKPFKMDITEEIKKINHKYKPIDEKLLRRKLEIKKENYERLTGDKYDKSR